MAGKADTDMRAGRLRHRITFQDRVNTADGNGGNTITWTDNREVWGSVEPAKTAKSREFYESATENANIDGKIVTRYFSGFDPTMRVSWKSRSRVFNIEAVVNPDERDKMFEILYSEVISS